MMEMAAVNIPTVPMGLEGRKRFGAASRTGPPGQLTLKKLLYARQRHRRSVRLHSVNTYNQLI